MHLILWTAGALLVGAGVGFGFRGWISRKKIALGEHVLAAVKNEEAWALNLWTEVKSKL